MSTDEVYRLLTNCTVETIRRNTHAATTQIVIRGDGNEVILVRNKGNNGWLLTGFELVEPVNQRRSVTPSSLRTNAPIPSRSNVVAALNTLSDIARNNVKNGLESRGNFMDGLRTRSHGVQDHRASRAIRACFMTESEWENFRNDVRHTRLAGKRRSGSIESGTDRPGNGDTGRL